MSVSPGSSQGSWSTWSPGGSSSNGLLTVDMTHTQLMEIGISTSPPPPAQHGASLVLTLPPESRFRYRYDTEMSGTHGSLQAEKGGREKNIPTVELRGYMGPAVVRVSLFTCNDSGPRYPHPHHLFVKEKLYLRRYTNIDGRKLYKTGHYIDPHYIVMNDNVARFEGMCIISTKKEQFQSVIREKLLERGQVKEAELDQTVSSALRHVDNAFVSLCFEAFAYDNGVVGSPICPPIYSKPIANAKNASTGRLKITKINKCSGSCRGGDSIWLLVEKINKRGLVVRFFETAPDGSFIWEADIQGDQLELHHQYAVIFNTPPYRDQEIARDVTVSMRLERRAVPFDYSDSESFVYEPSKPRPKYDNIYRKEGLFSPSVPSKRPIADLFAPVPSKRRNEEPFPIDMFPPLEESQVNTLNAILQELQELITVPQYENFAKTNEDFYQSFVPGPYIETDSAETPASRAIVLLRLLLQAVVARAQLKDQDLRTVTEQIGRLFLRHDDLRLQDAASTLLSMRSRGNLRKSVHEAIASGESEAVATALQSGADPGEVDKAGRTPLHVSVEAGLFPCVQLLLKCDSRNKWIDARNKQGLTALHLAISKRDVAAMKDLLSAGANVNVPEPTKKRSPLHMAVKNKDAEMIRHLLRHQDINVQYEDVDGVTAVQLAKDDVGISGLFVKVETPSNTFEKIADILNRSGKWKNLAELWDCADLIDSAEDASNHTLHLINLVEQNKQGVDLDILRNLLDLLDETEAVAVIDEALAKTFL